MHFLDVQGQKTFQLQGFCSPDLLTKGSAQVWTPMGAHPQNPIIRSRSVLAIPYTVPSDRHLCKTVRHVCYRTVVLSVLDVTLVYCGQTVG